MSRGASFLPGEGELDHQQGDDRRRAAEMVAQHRARERALALRGVAPAAEPHGAGHGARGGEADRRERQRERGPAGPRGLVAAGDLGDDGRERRHHDGGDQAAHGVRIGRDAAVVAGDRGQHVLGQRVLGAPQRLDVEHQVEPQDGEQEAGACGDEGDHAPSIPAAGGSDLLRRGRRPR